MEQDTVEWRIGSLYEEVVLWECRWGGTGKWRDLAEQARRDNSRVTSASISQHISVGRDLINGLRNIWDGAIVHEKEMVRNWQDAFHVVDIILYDISLLH